MNTPKKNIQKKAAVSPVNIKQQEKLVSINSRDLNVALLAGVAVVIFICFHYTLQNRFLTNWDDWIYVNKDPYITAFTAANLNSMLFHDITLNYYHPLTMLSLAVNYQFSHLNPFGYYLTNILLHILNAILIFYFIKTLMGAMTKVGYKAIPFIPWIAAIGALVHGIHPMHVESVAWLAERKDVMYSVFYFAGLMMYIRYTEGATFRWMPYLNIVLALLCVAGIICLRSFSLDFTIKGHNFSIWIPLIFIFFLTLLVAAILVERKYIKYKPELFYVLEFFLLSLFSKPMAVSFPLSMLVIDILLKRDVQFISKGKNWIYEEGKALFKLVAEKWMFLVIAFLSGLQSIFLEVGHDTVVFTHGYSVFQKLLISCYSFTMYAFKAIWPVNLCSYYPFPNLTSDYHLPPLFYVTPFLAAAIVLVPLCIVRKEKDLFRVMLFGIGFYFANVVFILQFLSAGTTIMSDRYSYVSYFGFIFILVYLAHWFWYKNKSYRAVISGVLMLICISLAYLAHGRTRVWHDPETLWSDVISKQGEKAPVAYFNLATYYADSSKYDKAYPEYLILNKLNSHDAVVYRNLAMIYGQRKQFDSSIYFFAKAIKYDSVDASIYFNRAITYANMKQFTLAVKDLSKSYSLDTTQSGTLAQRASMYIQVGQLGNAVNDYTTLIRRNSKEPTFYLSRGNAYLNGGKPAMALKDYLHLLELQPNNGECLYNLSIAYHALNNNTDALKYATMSQTIGYKLPDGYLNKLK